MSTQDCASLDLESLGRLPKSDREDSQETPRILLYLSSYLEKSVRKNENSFQTSKTKDVVTIFHGTRSPFMSISSCFDCLTSLNIHRLLITSTLIASKFIDDKGYNNAYFAKWEESARQKSTDWKRTSCSMLISDSMCPWRCLKTVVYSEKWKPMVDTIKLILQPKYLESENAGLEEKTRNVQPPQTISAAKQCDTARRTTTI